MAPPKWTTPEEEKFLHTKLEPYLKAKGNQDDVPLTCFWDQLEIIFFAKFPAEAMLNLPPPVEGEPLQPLTAEQLAVVGAKTSLTKDCLKQWMRYQDQIRTRPAATRKAGKHKGLFKLLSKQSTQALRPVELYQGLYHAKIKDAVMARGYQGLADSDEEPVSPIMVEEVGIAGAMIAAETASKTRIRALRAARMSMWQTTARELYAEEPEEVRQEMERLTSEENVKRGVGAAPPNDEVVKTLELYQLAIDQIGAVFTTVHDMTLAETGWMGFTMLGGPMPRRKGEISTKTICFGQSANGNYFSAALPDFDTRIKVPFVQWLK
ncbi:hypothetical protein DFH08DRAFT_946570 [Mycena albidolilacea]|uniref:Uncharacterized protein n=1 Tax=Mycena albidolilacea TaxID=1033008 RepID=A0AAD7F5L4_9AGAR|nr:hypothetical protein DFH08DRAFT_946570 [Mycena albidolilacea]